MSNSINNYKIVKLFEIMSVAVWPNKTQTEYIFFWGCEINSDLGEARYDRNCCWIVREHVACVVSCTGPVHSNHGIVWDTNDIVRTKWNTLNFTMYMLQVIHISGLVNC